MIASALQEVSNYEKERAERSRRHLERAKQAARCAHVFLDGRRCRAPKMKGGKLCRMHQSAEEARAVKLDLGPMEDPDSIQLGIRKMVAAVIDGKLEKSQVSQLSYLIQLAAWNVRGTKDLVSG